MFFQDLDAGKVEMVGGKNANLGEMRTRVEVPVPNGFAITSYAYKTFLDYNNITERITEMLGSWRMSDLDSLGRVSEELKETIYEAQMPPELVPCPSGSLRAPCRSKKKCRPFLAVRSSAIGEDLSFTFAGQVCHLPECVGNKTY